MGFFFMIKLDAPVHNPTEYAVGWRPTDLTTGKPFHHGALSFVMRCSALEFLEAKY